MQVMHKREAYKKLTGRMGMGDAYIGCERHAALFAAKRHMRVARAFSK